MFSTLLAAPTEAPVYGYWSNLPFSSRRHLAERFRYLALQAFELPEDTETSAEFLNLVVRNAHPASRVA